MIQAHLPAGGMGKGSSVVGQDRAQMRERALRGSYMVRVLTRTSGKGRRVVGRARRRVHGAQPISFDEAPGLLRVVHEGPEGRRRRRDDGRRRAQRVQ